MLTIIRSAIYQVFMVVCISTYAVIILAFNLFVPQRWQPWFPGLWGRTNTWALRWICGLHYRVEGQENIPAEGGGVTFWKHQSAWDTMAQMFIFPPNQCWVLKKSLTQIPLVGWAISRYRPIAIDRSNGRKAVKQVIEQGFARVKEGLWVIIFPEGTRVAPGETHRYGTSGVLLAQKAGQPIIPVAHNAGDFWQRNGFLKHPGTIIVRIGAPIDTQDQPPKVVAQTVQDWIETQMKDISENY